MDSSKKKEGTGREARELTREEMIAAGGGNGSGGGSGSGGGAASGGSMNCW